MILGKFLITMDSAMDYTPFVGVVNNSVDILLKVALKTLSLAGAKELTCESSLYARHINDKKFKHMILFAIPIIGTFAKIIMHIYLLQPSRAYIDTNVGPSSTGRPVT